MLIFTANSNSFYRYKIATQNFLCSNQVKGLEYLFTGKCKFKQVRSNNPYTNFINPESIYTGPGLISDYIKNINFNKQGRFFKLSIGNNLEFIIESEKSNKFIYIYCNATDYSNRLLIDSLLGPVIIFSLAMGNTFCIHSSCVKYGNSAILLIGKSGKGKSTISKFLHGNSSLSFEHLTDDITPIMQHNDQYYVLPHFPQLKLKPDERYSKDKPGMIKLARIYLLDKNTNRKSVIISPMNTSLQLRSLIEYTIASLLFDKKINSQHLKFCSDIIDSIQIKRLSYPDNTQKLDDIMEKLTQDMNE